MGCSLCWLNYTVISLFCVAGSRNLPRELAPLIYFMYYCHCVRLISSLSLHAVPKSDLWRTRPHLSTCLLCCPRTGFISYGDLDALSEVSLPIKPLWLSEPHSRALILETNGEDLLWTFPPRSWLLQGFTRASSTPSSLQWEAKNWPYFLPYSRNHLWFPLSPVFPPALRSFVYLIVTQNHEEPKNTEKCSWLSLIHPHS